MIYLYFNYILRKESTKQTSAIMYSKYILSIVLNTVLDVTKYIYSSFTGIFLIVCSAPVDLTATL